MLTASTLAASGGDTSLRLRVTIQTGGLRATFFHTISSADPKVTGLLCPVWGLDMLSYL